MSENLDLVRSIVAAWEHGDFLGTAEWAHPDIEFVVADGPEPGSWSGLARAEKGGWAVLSPFEHARIEAEQYRELDRDRILVFVHSSGRGGRADWTSRTCTRRRRTWSTSATAS